MGRPTRKFANLFRLMKIYPFRDYTLSRVLVCAISRQIDVMSASKTAHQIARQDRERRYRELFEQMGSGSVIYEAVDDGSDFAVAEVNRAGEAILRVARADAIGRRLSELFPSEVADELLDVVRRVWTTGEAERHPVRIQDGGAVGWHDTRVFKLPGTASIVTICDEPTEVRSILDSFFGFIAIFMPDGTLIEANRASLETAHLTREAVVGQPFWETVWWSHSPAMQDQVRAALERAAAGETVRQDLSVRIGPDKTITVDTSFGPLRDSQNQINRLIGFGVEITKRESAEARLAESEARLANAQRIAHIGNWDWDIVTGDLHWSDEIYRIFGLKPQEFGATYETFLATIHADDRTMVEEAVAASLDEHAPYNIDHRIVLPTGEVRTVHEQGEVERDADGRPIAMRGTVQDITESRAAEDALKESLERFKDFAASASDFFWEMDENLCFSYFSERFSQVTGVETDQLIGKTRQETRMPGVDPEAWEQHLADLAGHKAFRGFVHPRTRPDGRVVYLSINGAPIFDEDGTFRGYRGTGSDITERKQAQEASQRSEAGLAYAQRMAHLGSWDLDVETGKAVWSDENYRIFGFEPGSVEPSLDLVKVLVHPADQEAFTENHRRAREGDKDSFKHEYRVIRRDGSQRFIHSTGELVRDDKGKPARLIGTVHDITERKQAEEALRLHAQIVDQIHDSVVSTDCDGIVTTWNKGAERLFGYLADEAIGRHISFVYPEEEQQKLASQVVEPTMLKGWHDVEVRMRRKSGECFSAHLSDSVLRDAGGEVIGRIGYSIDISERKQAEEALREAVAQAEFANRSKGEFLANMSHELRTPLNAIIGFSEAMHDEMIGPLGNPAYKDYAQSILDSGKLLLSLIGDILDLSKIEAGKLELHENVVNVAEAVNACQKIVEGRAKDAGVVLETRMADDLPGIWVDERSIKQIVLNLLSNAVKFTPKGGCVTVDASIDKVGRFVLAVSDTG
ncbi:MAG: PAS domain S-box protein, partial [Alphaproteobacteria bacterium]|nr:PAS domain S-box protein [Alphaproteobacteria bacterium]